MTAVVLCVGNAFRGDDGVGAAVAAELAGRDLPAGVRVVELDGEPARLVAAWEGADLAVVVDAAVAGALPGTVHRVDVGADGLVPPTHPTSTHGYDLGDAVELGRALGRLPARLVALGVEGADFADGPGLTPEVAAAVAGAADAVVAELTAPPSSSAGRSAAPPAPEVA